MKPFMPKRVYFEPSSLDYDLGRRLYHYFTEKNIPIIKMTSSNRVTGIPGKTDREKYFHAKQTLVVSVKRNLELDRCKPSADFQFGLYTSCPGKCQYCYLQTTQGTRPFIRVYVNLGEIFETIEEYIEKNKPKITTFEAASTNDPLALEHITGSIKETIEFFARQALGRLRLVTKFDNVDGLLDVHHNKHTRFRFSINTDFVINAFEHGTATAQERIAAARKMAGAEYPIGFIIAPIMVYPKWKDGYKEMMDTMYNQLHPFSIDDLTFELIQYRYTQRAKHLILNRFPNTRLDMGDTQRTKKWGRYGMFKYIYPKELADEIRTYLSDLIYERFPNATIEYFT
jgi:spore photoproduct lyase